MGVECVLVHSAGQWIGGNELESGPLAVWAPPVTIRSKS